MDRRTFFHTEGKSLAFKFYGAGAQPTGANETCEIGELVELYVEEIHFGNPRVRLQGEPAMMPQMLKWSAEKFDEQVLKCAQVSYGTNFCVWCAVGIPSNRILYAMKRVAETVGITTVRAEVVPAPPPPSDDDADLTYGASIQGIQLVP